MKAKYVGKIVVFFMLIILVFLGLNGLLRIKELSCNNQFGACDLSELEDSVKGKNLFLAKMAVSKYLESNLSISEFSLRYKPFNKLDIYAIVDVPKYGLRSEDFDSVAQINRQGYVSSIESETSIPAIETTGILPNVGDAVDERTLFALEIYYRVYTHSEIGKGVMYNDKLEVESSEGKIIFPLEGDQDVLIGAMTLILSRLKDYDEESKIDGVGGISEIDLRFDNPVLR